MEFVREDKRGSVYSTDSFRIYYANGTGSFGNNDTNPREKIVLISGTLHINISGNIKEHTSPAEIDIPAKTPHSIESEGKSTFLVFAE